jgi:hypothetical protein
MVPDNEADVIINSFTHDPAGWKPFATGSLSNRINKVQNSAFPFILDLIVGTCIELQ